MTLEQVAQLGPAATAAAALVALLVGWRTLRQRRKADDRAEWWRRTQWATDAATSDNEARRLMGLRLLGVLADSPLANPEDLRVIFALVHGLITDGDLDNSSDVADDEREFVLVEREDDDEEPEGAR